MQAAESKIRSYDAEISSLRSELKELTGKLETAISKAQMYEKDAMVYQQEKIHLEQKYQSEFARFAEVQERCRNAEKEAARAVEVADKARAEAGMAQKEKSEMQKLAMERQSHIERAERRIENLGRQKDDLEADLLRTKESEKEALSRVAELEERVEQREKQIDSLLDSNDAERKSNVQILQNLLESERAAHAEASNRAEALSLQLQSAQSKIDSLHQEVTKYRLNEIALDGKLKTASHGKRLRVDGEAGVESVQDMDISPRILKGSKRSKSTTSPVKYTHPEDGGSVFEGDDNNHSQQSSGEDYKKFTVLKLKQELTKHNYGDQLLQLKNPSKKNILALYEKCVLQKS